MKARMMGSGWHKESLRHSNARRLGKAGGMYHGKIYVSDWKTGKLIETQTGGTLYALSSKARKSEIYPYYVKISDTQQGHKELIKGGLGDYKPDASFNKKSLKQGMKVEKEHTNNPLIAKEIAKDHLTEDPQYYEKLQAIEKAPTPPLSKESTSLPIQFSINVPRTYDKDKKLTQKEFEERIKETKKFLSKKFGGDTTIKAKGDYTSDNKLITEDVAIVETSMTRNDYEKNKEKLGRFIKQKRNEWGQETIGYTLEGDFLMYPKF